MLFFHKSFKEWKVTGSALKVIDEYLRIALNFYPEIKERWKNTTKK